MTCQFLSSPVLPCSVAICSTSILLGVLFTSLLFDSAVLFGSQGAISPEIIGFVESYYLTWWDGAMAVKMFLHVVVSGHPLVSGDRKSVV